MSTRTSTMRTRQSSRTAGAQSQNTDPQGHSEEKESIKMNGPGKARVTRRGAAKQYCLCKKPDDGSPMIRCSTCKDWFHFRCVDLTEQDASEIKTYACPPCHQNTGARTINSRRNHASSL
ncbi:hypothetical protein C8Q74DRAFT_1246565 [Fomes fomentarius]|nr:hypothetical protein C8Q74DRAFT_1246565 [Fomes fomentarius]